MNPTNQRDISLYIYHAGQCDPKKNALEGNWLALTLPVFMTGYQDCQGQRSFLTLLQKKPYLLPTITEKG